MCVLGKGVLVLFLCVWESVCVCNWYTWGQFHQHFTQSFYMPRSWKRKKKTDNLTVFFVLSGYACIKAAHKMLVKLTPVTYHKEDKTGHRWNLLHVHRSTQKRKIVIVLLNKLNGTNYFQFHLITNSEFYISLAFSFKYKLWANLRFREHL